MKQLSFAIISNSLTENTQDLITAIEGEGHHATLINMKEIVFHFEGDSFRVTHQGIDIETSDIFLFRSYSQQISSARLIAHHLCAQGKIVVDEALGTRSVGSKNFQHAQFSKYEIPYPKCIQAHSTEAILRELPSINFPIIAKPLNGSKGNGMFKFETLQEALDTVPSLDIRYLYQEYIPIDSDIRVFIVGNKVLGAMKRYVVPGDFRSNAALGSKTVSIPLAPELEKLALKARESTGYEVAGIDIIETNKGLMVLEINNCPEWQAFKKTTGINPASEIIRFAIAKYQTKHP